MTRFLWLSLILWGGLAIVLARQVSFLPALMLYLLLGLPYAGLQVVIGPLLLHTAPRLLVGRITSIFLVCMGMTWTASTALASYAESTLLHGLHAHVSGLTIGPIDTLFTAVGLLSIAAGLVVLISLSAPAAPTTPPKPLLPC